MVSFGDGGIRTTPEFSFGASGEQEGRGTRGGCLVIYGGGAFLITVKVMFYISINFVPGSFEFVEVYGRLGFDVWASKEAPKSLCFFNAKSGDQRKSKFRKHSFIFFLILNYINTPPLLLKNFNILFKGK